MRKIIFDKDVSDRLKEGKHLLAFSGGSDSSALFHLLLEKDVAFDMAHVNYGTRAQSSDEEAYVKEIANRFCITSHIYKADPIKKNFEANARKVRYNFFKELLEKYGYDTLITAHHLNDKLEWLLMRLSKGAGIAELNGMQNISTYEGITVARPLLMTPKSALLDYLSENNISYFEDETNLDEAIERNYFRHRFSNELIEKYAKGIAKSFEILQEQTRLIDSLYETIYEHKELTVVKLLAPKIASYAAQKTLKAKGYLISGRERERIDNETSIVIGRKWAVAKSDNRLFIAPYRQTVMPKVFKERCRKRRIPPLIRGYLYEEGIDPGSITL